MKLLKEFRIFGKDRVPVKGVTPEQQKVYEEQLKVRAKTGRIVTIIVCVMNIFVSGIVALTNMGWLLIIAAAVGLFFAVKGRNLGRILHVAVCFLMALIGYSAANWIILDYTDIVVHVFYKETRDLYKLEKLWSDGVFVDISEYIKPD